jgi:hypothetical protein
MEWMKLHSRENAIFKQTSDFFPSCMFSLRYQSNKVRNKIRILKGGLPKDKIALGNSSSRLSRFNNQIKAFMLNIRAIATRHLSIEVKVSFIRGVLILTKTDLSIKFVHVSSWTMTDFNNIIQLHLWRKIQTYEKEGCQLRQPHNLCVLPG